MPAGIYEALELRDGGTPYMGKGACAVHSCGHVP